MKIVITSDMTQRAIALANRATRNIAVSIAEKRELFNAFLDRQVEKAELKFPEWIKTAIEWERMIITIAIDADGDIVHDLACQAGKWIKTLVEW